jgi:hypothetical protein
MVTHNAPATTGVKQSAAGAMTASKKIRAID